MFQKLFLVFLLSSLSGCAVYNESFDCPVGKGIACASLSHVNNKMDKGTLKSLEEETSKSDTFFGEAFLGENTGEN